MADDNINNGSSLFGGLPPPCAPPPPPPPPPTNDDDSDDVTTANKKNTNPPNPPNPPPAVVLKSALKRPKPIHHQDQDEDKSQQPPPPPQDIAPAKRLRFKTTTDASELQVIEAMKKISSHINNLSKVSKASKLAVQLIQAGSVKPTTSNHFFSILESAMSSLTACNDPSVRADYHALFLAAQDATECLNRNQRNQLTTWSVRAVLANELFTDDSFVFSKASGKIKDAILQLPVATAADDLEEADALKDKDTGDADNLKKEEIPSVPTSEGSKNEESDPFGLDALIPNNLKKDEKTKGKKDGSAKFRKEEDDENKRFLKCQREALIYCLEIAARRYKIPWCQTVIDILVKHAFDNISRFTSQQRHAIEKLWVSIREQQARRKQGKSVTGKLDVNAFESLQEKYANEKISIRRAVGGGGNRRAEQWLG